MFVRCANGRVYDLELKTISVVVWASLEAYVLDKIEHGHPVADRRQQTCSIWREQQVASAVDGTEQIGELASRKRCRRSTVTVARRTWKSVFIVEVPNSNPASRLSTYRGGACKNIISNFFESCGPELC